MFGMVLLRLMVRTRIAPSPTGAPHIGTAYTALFNYAFAKQNRGKFLLRIEDTDRTRLVPGAEEQIIEALKWLGLGWDEGPFRQSERLPLYQKHAEELVKKGKAYYCFCSEERLEEMRREQQKRGLPPKYDGRCRKLSRQPPRGGVPQKAGEASARGGQGREYVIRLKVPETGETSFTDLIRGKITFQNAEIDDQVLLKSDGFPTYHLAVVVDDYLMEITHVIRAEEWISSTPKHVLLYQAFGWEPPAFAHLPLLRERDHAKLSKRHGAVGILEFREEGYLPEAILNFLALLGWSHPEEKDLFPLSEFIEKLDLRRVSTSAPVFDREKLNWMNGEHIRAMSVGELGVRLREYLKSYRGLELDSELVERIAPLIRERIKKLFEFEELAGFFFKDVAWSRELLVQKGRTAEGTKEALRAVLAVLREIEDWSAKNLETRTRTFLSSYPVTWSPSDLFMTLRIAISGQKVSPPLFESMEVLGKEKTLQRIEKAASIL